MTDRQQDPNLPPGYREEVEKRREKIEKGAKDFAIRFEGVMKELSDNIDDLEVEEVNYLDSRTAEERERDSKIEVIVTTTHDLTKLGHDENIAFEVARKDEPRYEEAHIDGDLPPLPEPEIPDWIAPRERRPWWKIFNLLLI